MKNNRASKAEAVKIIRRAIQQGWHRHVSAMKFDHSPTPWNIQVSMDRAIHFANGIECRSNQIIVSFTRHSYSGRMSVSIVTHGSGMSSRKHGEAGWWSANYTLNETDKSIATWEGK